MKISKHEVDSNAKIYKPNNPFLSRVISKEIITNHDGPDEVVHLVLDLKDSELKYVEGQSIGVIAPGLREDGKPNKLRLYSITSSRSGDKGNMLEVSLCVRRLIEKKSDTNEIYNGLASTYLCDVKVGDKIMITGAVGKAFALPTDITTNLIMFATGTGIAPFRAFLNFIYKDPNGPKKWLGKIYLFFGAKSNNELLYMNELNSDMKNYPLEQVKVLTCRSREEKNEEGGRLYVQHKLISLSEEIYPIIEGHTSIYICGLKGMSKGLDESFEKIYNTKNKNWLEKKKQLQLEGRWNVEEY